MPKSLPEEEPNTGSAASRATAEAAQQRPPRTVNRRAPRTTLLPDLPQQAPVEGPDESDAAVVDAAEPDIVDAAEPDIVESDIVELDSVEPTEAAEAVEPDEPQESAAAGDAKRATTRVEVPVPSVARARERAVLAAENPVVLRAESLTKTYGQVLAAADVTFDVHAGSLTGVVGPNGAGKTTVLSMISGLNRPTSGRIAVGDIDVWRDGPAAKRVIGSLPDRLRLFDRLTGGQLLYYAGVLQGLKQATVAQRATELAKAFALESALDRPVSDYSAGMQKKIGLACSMIHSPDVLVLDEPYETIDPVSASNVTEILEKYVAGGGSVIMSSHSLDLIQRICDHVVVIVDGSIVAQGTVDEVRDGVSLEERFRHLSEQQDEGKGLEWLHGSSDSD